MKAGFLTKKSFSSRSLFSESREDPAVRSRNPLGHPFQGVLIAMGVVVVFLVFLVLLTLIIWLIA